jgi:hypothetical protein
MAEEEEDNGREPNGRFKRGNLFSIGNTGGRPPIYDDPKVMMQKIAEYLDWEDDNKGLDSKKVGKGLYTLEGCALFLGFATRDSMYDYEKKNSEFSYILSRFRTFMAHWNAQKLYWAGTTGGAQFWLKNFGGYTDEVIQHQHQTITKVEPKVVTGDAPPLSASESEVDK